MHALVEPVEPDRVTSPGWRPAASGRTPTSATGRGPGCARTTGGTGRPDWAGAISSRSLLAGTGEEAEGGLARTPVLGKPQRERPGRDTARNRPERGSRRTGQQQLRALAVVQGQPGLV